MMNNAYRDDVEASKKAEQRWRLVTTPAEKRSVSIILGCMGAAMVVGALAAGGILGAVVIAGVTGGLVWLLNRRRSPSASPQAPRADGPATPNAYRDDLEAAKTRVSDLEREAEQLRTRNAELRARVVVETPRDPGDAIKLAIAKAGVLVAGIAGLVGKNAESDALAGFGLVGGLIAGLIAVMSYFSMKKRPMF